MIDDEKSIHDWSVLLTNPEAIRSLYRVVPLLCNIDIVTCLMHRDGPKIEMSVLLPCYPDYPPKRWEKTSTGRVAIKLAFIEAYLFRFTGISATTNGVGDFEKMEKGIRFYFKAPDIDVEVASSFLSISSIAPV